MERCLDDQVELLTLSQTYAGALFLPIVNGITYTPMAAQRRSILIIEDHLP